MKLVEAISNCDTAVKFSLGKIQAWAFSRFSIFSMFLKLGKTSCFLFRKTILKSSWMHMLGLLFRWRPEPFQNYLSSGCIWGCTLWEFRIHLLTAPGYQIFVQYSKYAVYGYQFTGLGLLHVSNTVNECAELISRLLLVPGKQALLGCSWSGWQFSMQLNQAANAACDSS